VSGKISQDEVNALLKGVADGDPGRRRTAWQPGTVQPPRPDQPGEKPAAGCGAELVADLRADLRSLAAFSSQLPDVRITAPSW
jgi:hypothetical protein